jgi:hypothetical protein
MLGRKAKTTDFDHKENKDHEGGNSQQPTFKK